MKEIVVALFFWWLGHSITMIYMTVFYHRYLSHKSFAVAPWLHSFILRTGNIATGIDPIGWVCMHRLHHMYSDTELDPHSPRGLNAIELSIKQLKQYKLILKRLITRNEKYTKIVSDIGFQPSIYNASTYWFVPYFIQMIISLVIGVLTGSFWNGLCFFIGISAHPIHGLIVNYYCHKYGHRNHETSDDSRNSFLFGVLLYGEGYHNNHHYRPKSFKFSSKWYEVDIGYYFIIFLSKLNLVKLKR